MEDADKAGFPWGEETVTEILLAAAHPEMISVAFNRWEEGRVGADWLWWWVDDAGEAFGALIQAKRLHSGWNIGFDYRNGAQRRLLQDSANRLGVPDVFVLYLGTRAFRTSFQSDTTELWRVLQRHNSGVSYVPGWTVRSLPPLIPGGVDSRAAVARSAPLEYLVVQSLSPSLAYRGATDRLDPRLRAFLTAPQTGARMVARTILDLVAEARTGQFRSSGAQGQAEETEHPLLGLLPHEAGHSSEPYADYVLKGLRPEAPDYIQVALQGEPTALPGEHPNVAGVTIMRLRGATASLDFEL